MSRRRRRNEEEAEGVADWMLTYSDLVTLLLTFFVMLFSMANIDKQKFEQVAMSLRSSFLQMSNGEMLHTNTGRETLDYTEEYTPVDVEELEVLSEALNEEPNMELMDVKEQLQKAIDEMNLNDYIKLLDSREEVIMRFNSLLLFDTGSAEIRHSGKELLVKTGQILSGIHNEIMVQGHTDNVPIETLIYPTNWELSTRRATNVVLFLVANTSMDATKLTATGNGEFKPLASNDTEEGRQKNRRIDVVIVK